MATGATGQLGLALPVQGELSGTWGDTVNNGITQYTNIAIAGTLSFAGDGAITLANTTGDATASNIGSTTAQYMVIRITGTQSVTKVITGPSYSKLYMVDHAGATSAVTFKASGQTGVSVAVGEKCFVYYNGTDYVKVSSSVADGVTSVGGTGTVNGISLSGTVTSTGNLTLGGALTGVSLTTQVTGTLPIANGGTGTTSTTFTNLTTNVTGLLPIANGGTNTATPALVQGTGVTITGTWPNQTINATGTGGTVTSVGGTGTVNGLTLTGTVTSSGNLTLGGTLSGIANSALSNSSVTVSPGTGLSGGGAVALGSSITLTNAVVTSIVAGSGISISGATGSVTVSASGGAGFSAKTTTYTAVSGDNILANTSGGSWTLTLPATPTTGNTVQVMDSNGTFDTYPLTVARNGQTIMGAAEDMTLSLEGVATTFVYNGSTWRVI
jgi:hypothetical protein